MGDYNQFLRNPFTWLTREIRTRAVFPYIPKGETHVDIGCGPEKYLLSKSPCQTRIGFDKQCANPVQDKIPLTDKSADCVSIVAAIEHLDYPEQIIKECRRILKDEGVLIITTPKSSGKWLMGLYDPYYEKREEPHKRYFNYETMKELLKGQFEITLYRTFALGFNQLFVCKKSFASL